MTKKESSLLESDKLLLHPSLAIVFSLAFGIAAVGWRRIDIFVIAISLFFVATILVSHANRIKLGAFTAFLLGAILMVNHNLTSAPTPPVDNRKVDILLTIKATETVQPRSIRYLAHIEKIDGRSTDHLARLYIRKSHEIENFLPGDKLSISKARIKKPRGFRNIGLFDYEKYLADRKISLLLFLSKGSVIKHEGVTIAWRRPLEIVKNKMRANLSFDDNDVSAVASATLLGDTGLILPQLREHFSRSGLAHLLAVSGLHVGFVAAATYFITRLLLFLLFVRSRSEWILSGATLSMAAIIAMTVAILYGLMTGPRFSATRATIMVSVYLIAVASGRGRNFIGAFSISMAIILILYPWAIFDSGFQLSFSAVFFIALFMERFYNRNKIVDSKDGPDNAPHLKTPWFQRFATFSPLLTGYGGVSLFAGIGAMPLAAYHFNVLPLLSLPINIAIAPVASIAIPLGIFSSITNFGIGLQVTEWMIHLVTASATTIGITPAASKTVAAFPAVAVALFYATIIFTVTSIFNGRRKKLLVSGLLILLLVAISIPYVKRNFEKGMAVKFLDVGQGFSAIATFDKGAAIVIDGGPTFETFDPGRNVLAPALFQTGVTTKVSALFASHGDRDHAGGLLGLASMVTPAKIYDHGRPSKDKALIKLRAFGARRGIYESIVAGDRLNFGKVLVEVFNPPNGNELLKYPKTDNNLSLVLRLSYGNQKFLFTGDISKEAEKWLVDSGQDFSADVLSVAHHGSNTSSSSRFLKATKAKHAVISAGFGNHFRFPSKNVIKRIQNSGMKIYRTDLSGEVRVKTDGAKLAWSSWSDQ